ncbi:MAG: DUF2142 domain-containing protein, partial [Lachnospiraceae bacterium]|nr:DUF2142 domain-containing protein [Lachnospiraceae bacterium]
APDEPLHFYRSYKFSNDLMGIKSDNPNQILMRKEDKRLLNSTYFAAKDKRPLLTRDNYVSEMSKLFKGSSSEEKSLITCKNISKNSYPISYIPSILGITIARILGMSSVGLIMLSRLFMLLIYSVLTSLAIRYIPFGKLTLGFVALLPISLQQGMAISYDGILNSLSFLLIGYILYLAYKKDVVTNRDIGIVGLLTLLIAPIKIVYVVIGLLFLLIPSDKFQGKKVSGKKKKHLIILVVMILGCLFIGVFSFARVSKAFVGKPGYYSLREFFVSPGSFGSLIKIFFKTFVRFPSYIESALGANLGWKEVGVKFPMLVGFVLLIFISALYEKGQEKFNLGLLKINTLFISVLLYTGCVLGALSWTLRSSGVIEGIQGRYFIPIMPILFLLFRNKSIVKEKNIDEVLIYSFAYVQMVSIAWVVTSCLFPGMMGVN